MEIKYSEIIDNEDLILSADGHLFAYKDGKTFRMPAKNKLKRILEHEGLDIEDIEYTLESLDSTHKKLKLDKEMQKEGHYNV